MPKALFPIYFHYFLPDIKMSGYTIGHAYDIHRHKYGRLTTTTINSFFLRRGQSYAPHFYIKSFYTINREVLRPHQINTFVTGSLVFFCLLIPHPTSHIPHPTTHIPHPTTHTYILPLLLETNKNDLPLSPRKGVYRYDHS